MYLQTKLNMKVNIQECTIRTVQSAAMQNFYAYDAEYFNLPKISNNLIQRRNTVRTKVI